MAKRRTIDELGYTVSSDVLHAIDLLQTRYGATDYRDSGHTTTAPTWIFELRGRDAEVAVRMNKRALTLYLRDKMPGGGKVTDLLPSDKVTKRYPQDGQPAQSVHDSPLLGASGRHECVLLALERSDLEPLFDAYFARPGMAEATPGEPPAAGHGTGKGGSRPVIDAEAFQAMLDRRSEVGKAGEMLAVEDELRRLESLGCPDPLQWVERVALVDVGRGFDIASTWPGQVRYIEVKSSSAKTAPVFISDNERRVLTGLGPRGWLYRVWIQEGGAGAVQLRLQDPMRALATEALKPVVFSIAADELTAAAGRKEGEP